MPHSPAPVPRQSKLGREAATKRFRYFDIGNWKLPISEKLIAPELLSASRHRSAGDGFDFEFPIFIFVGFAVLEDDHRADCGSAGNVRNVVALNTESG